MPTEAERAGQYKSWPITGEQQKAANKLANERMRADGLDPVKDQRKRMQYYMAARADVVADANRS